MTHPSVPPSPWRGARLTLLAILMVLACAAGAPVPHTQAQATRDPTPFFLPDDALPPGFVHQPDADQRLTFAGGTSLLRLYRRATTEDDADHVTLLQVFIQTFDDDAQAQAVYASTVSGWEGQGYRLSEQDDLAGSPAVLGRKTFAEGTMRPIEGLVVYEHLDAMNIGVQWGDFADLPNREDALDLLHQLEAWVLDRLAEEAASQP
jgi:hypothetical protein